MSQLRRRAPAGALAIALLVTQLTALGHTARAATTLVVTTTADLAPPCSGPAFSLRCALVQANQDGVGDTIVFHIPARAAGCVGAPAVCTIAPRAALPSLTASNTAVNGYSQPGARPNTNVMSAGDNAVLTIRLDGSKAGLGVDGLVLLGGHDTVQGLSITGFQTCFDCSGIPGLQTGGAGVRVNGASDVVAGNFLGATPDGTTAGPNQFAGVNIGPAQFNGAAGPDLASPGGDVIGGTTPAASNVLSGNSDCTLGTCEGSGLYVNAGGGNVIERNYIGTTASGTAALTNTATGVVILSSGNVLGSATSGNGNVISSSGGDGILIGSSSNLIVGNLIGADATGAAGLGNRSHGLDVQGASNTIRGNLISANGDTGLVLLAAGNVVQGNRIGTDAAGMSALGNGLHPSAIFLGQPINGTDGIVVCAGPNTIGGTAAGVGNLISANAGDGISLVSSGNTVQGNTIGANATGTTALPNGVDGLGSRSFVFKGVGLCQQAPDNGGSNNTIGGSAPGAGNLISGNTGDGVDLVASNGNTIAGNRIGVNTAGTAALPNGGDGIFLGAFCDNGVCQGSSDNTVGGTSAGAGNVIGGNAGNGVRIDGTGGGINNVVQGNHIGADPTGTAAVGNRANGVSLGNGAVNDSVGGTAAGAGNTITNNRGAGVLIGVPGIDPTTHSAVQQNAIFANGGLGIDLAPQGVVNCTTPPPGPNDYTPCPLISAATTSRVSGTACANCSVEVYIATGEADDQGHGEGRTFLGSAVADGTGAWSLGLTAGQVSTGQQVTATATTPAGFLTAPETSEFAANVTVN